MDHNKFTLTQSTLPTPWYYTFIIINVGVRLGDIFELTGEYGKLNSHFETLFQQLSILKVVSICVNNLVFLFYFKQSGFEPWLGLLYRVLG